MEWGNAACALLQSFLGRSGRIAEPSRVTSLVMLECTRLGDVIAALPAVDVIRQSFPDATIHLVVKSAFADLVSQLVPGVSVHGVADANGPASLFSVISTVRALSPNLAVSLGPGRLNGLGALLSGAGRIAGYLDGHASVVPFKGSNSVSRIGFTGSRKEEYGREPLSARALKVCAVLGLENGQPPIAVRYARKSDVPVKEPSARRIALHPFSAWFFRSWPQEAFAGLCRILLERTAHLLLILGGPKDGRAMDTMRRLIGPAPRVQFLAGEPLTRVADLLRVSDLFIGNDTGMLHLAVTLGVPSVGLYGPAAPELTKPVGARNGNFISLYHHLECSPCDQVRCVRPHDSCMQKIDPNTVADAAMELLRRPGIQSIVHV